MRGLPECIETVGGVHYLLLDDLFEAKNEASDGPQADICLQKCLAEGNGEGVTAA